VDLQLADWFEWNALENSHDVWLCFHLVNDEYPLAWDKRHPWDEYCPATMPAVDLHALYKRLHKDQSDDIEGSYQFLVLGLNPTVGIQECDFASVGGEN
jgi:hypothetical protein